MAASDNLSNWNGPNFPETSFNFRLKEDPLCRVLDIESRKPGGRI
jgi:hypothetical protein